MITLEIKRIVTDYFKKQKLPIYVAVKNNSVEISGSENFEDAFDPQTQNAFALTLSPVRKVDANENTQMGFKVADAITAGIYKGHLSKLLAKLYGALRSDYYYDELILQLDANENPQAWKNIANNLDINLV
jgi:hypothetical protein